MFISVKDKKEVENLLQNIFCINMGMGVKSIQYLPSTRSLSRFYERSKNRTQKKKTFQQQITKNYRQSSEAWKFCAAAKNSSFGVQMVISRIHIYKTLKKTSCCISVILYDSLTVAN